MWEIARRYYSRSLLVALLGSLAFIAYLKYAPPSSPVTSTSGPTTVASPPKVVEKIKYVKVPGPRELVVIPKAELAARIKMPELEREIGVPVDTASIPAHIGPTTTVTLLDNTTGTFRTIMRQEPPPFLQIKREFLLQGRYLFAGGNLAEADLVASPVRLGPVNLQAGVGVELRRGDNSLGGRAFVGFEYRF